MSRDRKAGILAPAAPSSMATTIRSIRRSLGLNTTAFATRLGVDQSMVSRYEAGKRMPGEIVLGKLLLLAGGPEKQPVLEYLSRLQGRPITEAEALSMAEREAVEQENIRRALQMRGSGELPDLARFGYLASLIISADREVDSSLIKILELWLAKASTPTAVDYFREAAYFLEVALGRVSQYQSGELRAKFRVTQPVDFGDGFTHRAGDILELSLPVASMFPHALVRIAEEEQASIKKLA